MTTEKIHARCGVDHPVLMLGSIAIRVGLGAVFAAIAIPKIQNPYAFLDELYAYQLVSAPVGIVIAVILPYLEMTIACCLFAGVALRGTFALVTALGIFSVFFQSYSLSRGLEIDCRDFSVFGGGEQINYWTITLTLILTAASVIGFVLFHRTNPSVLEENI